jgi:hypothetical protein
MEGSNCDVYLFDCSALELDAEMDDARFQGGEVWQS